MSEHPGWKGRGAATNPANRFELRMVEPDPDALDEVSAPETQVLPDRARTILTRNDSPDIGFTWSLNPYRGCEHGCPYCYSRPYHEYLGLSAGLDFETRLFVKEDAPDLLRKELAAPKWVPDVVALSGVTDAYQPIERRLQVTRRCLEVFAEFRNPVGIVTKNALVARDADLLADLARDQAALVMVSVTSLDGHLAGVMEPRASRPHARLEAIRQLRAAGVPVGAAVAPIIPGLNDHEIPAILAAVAEAGAQWAFHTVLRLPGAVADLFADWLERHFPERKEKVLGRVRDLRGGKLNESRFGVRMTGEGPLAEQIRALFRLSCRRVGLGTKAAPLSTAAFRSGRFVQKTLF
jgi:DNA repair photolyase